MELTSREVHRLLQLQWAILNDDAPMKHAQEASGQYRLFPEIEEFISLCSG